MRWLCFLALFSSEFASAETPLPPKHRLVYNEIVGVRNNPIGAMNLIEVLYRYRLNASDHMLLDDTHASIGPFFDLNPAAASLGTAVRLKPLAVLQVTASHAWIGYFGNFRLVQSFDSPDIDYSDTQLNINEDEGKNFPTTGTVSKVEAVLQAKAGPIAVRSTFLGTHYNLDTEGKPLWFDTGLDVLAPDKGWVIKNDLDTLWVTDKGFAFGGRWTWTRPLLGSLGRSVKDTDRVGPIVAYRWGVNPGSKFSSPTFIFMSQWYVRHRYRTGDDVHQAIPYFAAALLFKGDLIPW